MGLYRLYLLRRLKRFYQRLADSGRSPTSPADLRQVRTLRGWDTLTVVPRFGFADADDYYARASVGSSIANVRCPVLIVASEYDPQEYLNRGPVGVSSPRVTGLRRWRGIH